MKLFLSVIIIILNLQSFTKANDIKYFEIEGMSLYDSALNYFSEKEILDNIRKDGYEGSDGNFYDIYLKKKDSKLYEKVSLAFKKNDKNYLIYSIGGIIFFGKDKEKCINKSKLIAEQVEELFPDHKKNLIIDRKHISDKTGKSKINGTTFIHRNSSGAEVSCYAWSQAMNLEDYVIVAIDSPEYGKWLDNYYDQN